MKKRGIEHLAVWTIIALMITIAAACEDVNESIELSNEKADQKAKVIFEELYRDEEAGVTGFDMFTEGKVDSTESNLDEDAIKKGVHALGTSKKFVVIVWEGAANDGRIFDSFLQAAEDTNGWHSYKGSHLNGWSSLSTAESEIDDAVSRFGLPRNQLNLLLVGKSFGGAKTYKLLYDNASAFTSFESTAVVTVDPHEPNPPGNEGRSGYWYDYVYFLNNTSDWNGDYDLAWHSRWNAFGSKLKNWNVYQREEFPKGYSFSDADVNTRTRQYDHWDIADCPYTISYIGAAISFLIN